MTFAQLFYYIRPHPRRTHASHNISPYTATAHKALNKEPIEIMQVSSWIVVSSGSWTRGRRRRWRRLSSVGVRRWWREESRWVPSSGNRSAVLRSCTSETGRAKLCTTWRHATTSKLVRLPKSSARKKEQKYQWKHQFKNHPVSIDWLLRSCIN